MFRSPLELNHKLRKKNTCALQNVGLMKKIILKNLEWQDTDLKEIQS